MISLKIAHDTGSRVKRDERGGCMKEKKDEPCGKQNSKREIETGRQREREIEIEREREREREIER